MPSKSIFETRPLWSRSTMDRVVWTIVNHIGQVLNTLPHRIVHQQSYKRPKVVSSWKGSGNRWSAPAKARTTRTKPLRWPWPRWQRLPWSHPHSLHHRLHLDHRQPRWRPSRFCVKAKMHRQILSRPKRCSNRPPSIRSGLINSKPTKCSVNTRTLNRNQVS